MAQPQEQSSSSWERPGETASAQEGNHSLAELNGVHLGHLRLNGARQNTPKEASSFTRFDSVRSQAAVLSEEETEHTEDVLGFDPDKGRKVT